MINLSLIKGCQLGRTLSQYNDLLLLHKCQVRAGTYFQSRRHLSCDSVVLKWLAPAAPNGGCKLSGAGAVDWKVPTVQSGLLWCDKGVGAQRGGSCALSAGCFVSKCENKLCDSHPPPTVGASERVLFCELLARLRTVYSHREGAEKTHLFGLTLISLQPGTTTAFLGSSHFCY